MYSISSCPFRHEGDYMGHMLKKLFFKKFLEKMIEEEFMEDEDEDEDPMGPILGDSSDRGVLMKLFRQRGHGGNFVSKELLAYSNF